MAIADRVTAVVLLALGIAMLTGGYTMDRLSIRQIHPLSIPGLVPMLLGGAMVFCAAILLVQAWVEDRDGRGTLMVDGSFGRLALTVALTVGYGVGLVGWLPFFWATAIFVALFTLVFSWSMDAEPREKVLTAAKSLAFGGIAAFAVFLLFEEAFLVRLP